MTSASVTVEVPASTANLGAGFDSLALALDLVDTIAVSPAFDLPPGEVFTDVLGEGASQLSGGRPSRFTEAFLGTVGDPRHGWRVDMKNDIPLARGLGSSAAATVAGLICGRVVGGRREMTDADLLAIATRLEGHPENAAAALLGGFVVAVRGDGRRGPPEPVVARFEPPPGLVAALFVPDRELPTDEMRAVLPDEVPREDAVHNVGRAALAVAAFATGRLDLLGEATHDRLHEPYRAVVFPALPAIVAAGRSAGALGACLSGAGPSVIAFSATAAGGQRIADAMLAAAEREGEPGLTRILRPRSAGATVTDRSAATA